LKLLRLHVENFGTLQKFDLDLSEGLNVLYEKNGWGKSTLAVFIKAMLYGLPASSRRSLDENERKKYTPWQGGAYGGSLEFSCGKGSFRIERFFGAKETADTFALYDLATNKPSSVFSASVGEELFGIDADGFERSTYLSQRLLATGKENNSISAKLGGTLDDVGDIGSFDVAMEALSKRRRHYVMTGNRGAIAEMEQARVEKQGELERCQRVKEAMEAQEAELAECAARIQEVRAQAQEARKALEQAGLARERAALIEHKDKMQRELALLRAQKAELDRFFQNGVPTPEGLSAARRLYEKLRETSVRLEMIPKESPDLATLNRLRARYSDPNVTQTLERLEEDNAKLAALRVRRDALKSSAESDELLHRFPAGAPKEASLQHVRRELEQAGALEKTMEALGSTQRTDSKRSPILPLGIVCAVLGIGLLIAAFLPFLQVAQIGLLAGGVACAVLGVALCALAAREATKNRRRAEELQESRQAWEDKRDVSLRTVRDFLRAYRMPAEQDPAEALTELTLLAAEYRRTLQSRGRRREELEAVERARVELATGIQTTLASLGQELPLREDYQTDLERVRRELLLLERLEDAEQKRIAERTAAEQTLEEQKGQLLPFLRHFDPNGKLRAGECLDRVSENLTEYNKLKRSIAEQTAQLRAFLAEKQLDPEERFVDADEFAKRTTEERVLGEELERLGRRHALLKSGIERLALDADRIPELEESLLQMKETIEEARANAVTLENTQKFLEEAKIALSTRYLGGMQTAFEGFLSTLIGKKAPEALMDTSFDVRLRQDGKTHTMESFSRGWRDAVQFCVRLSLTDALYADGERPFLLLDDPFVNLDDEKLEAAHALLQSLASRYQILYLVCHKDRTG